MAMRCSSCEIRVGGHHHHHLTMAEIKIILSPMSMSLNDLDEKKVNFDNLHHATTSSAAAAAVDGNDNDNIVDKETTKGCECEGEEEEVVCSFKTLPQPLRLTITERSSPTTAKGAGSQGDDGSIEVEVKKCAPTTAGLPSATDIRSSSSSSDSAQSDQLKVRADNNHSSAAADDTGYTSVEKPVDDKVDYQPDFSEASNGAREGDSSDSGSILGSTKASSVSPSPLKGDNDGIMSRQKDQQRIDCNCNCSYSEEASMTMTAHLGSTGTTSFPSTGLGEALCVPQKPRTCTEDSSLLTTASSTTTPVEVIDNNVEEEEDNDTVSDSLALLNVSRDGGMVMDNAPRRGTANSESECSSTTAPMITFRLLGEDLIDNISMNSDRMTATTESMDDNRSKSIISDGSEETGITPSQLGKIMHIRVSPKAEENEAARSLRTSNACIGYYDKTKLTERLKERLSKRDQTNGGADASSPTTEVGCESSKPVRDLARDRLRWESRLQAASQQRRPCVPRAKSSSFTKATTNRDMRFPDTVAFSDGSDDGTSPQPQHHRHGDTKVRSHYRKSFSEVGIPSSFSTTGRSSRSKLTKNRQSLAHGIGILQPDGIVYDDALLLRLARNARYGRLRGEVVNAAPYDNDGLAAGGARQYNHVKIHVYDLMTNDSLVEMPYFNCNFPIGHCFKVVNDGCHMFGTGAYHVGVEVNGTEYAFGANNIIGMCGIFTCVPKESPGYEYRQTIDFGPLRTTKRTWIRIPRRLRSTSTSRDHPNKDGEKSTVDDSTISSIGTSSSQSSKSCIYSFCEIESFADGHAVIHSMAPEYMGSNYDLLRKNCCTFALDVCIRLGVEKSDIPRWFYNAAQAGADAEDVISNVEKSVWGMLDCHGGMDPSDLECYNHGFEVIMDEKKTHNCDRILTVVESPAMRTPRVRRPLNDFNETASWTY